MLQSVAQVDIEIVNENDNQPSFANTAYEFRIAENQPARPLVATSPAGLTMVQVKILSCSHALSLMIIT